MPFDTNTRPVQDGGIDLSAIDIEAAIFKATGGGYGGGGTSSPTTEGGLTKSPDWVTNYGSTPVVDEFDFSKPPSDPNDLIKLVSEPEVMHPLMDLFKGDDAPNFANGGPEGISCDPVTAGAALIVGAFLLAAAELAGLFDDERPDPAPNGGPSGEKDPQTGLNIWTNKLVDPDAVTGDLQSPAALLADLLGRADVFGIDTSSIEITDILGKLSDNMGKVADLVGALQSAAKTGDSAAFGGALADLMKLAGLDGALDGLTTAPQDVLQDNIFNAFGLDGGLEGGFWFEVLQGEAQVEAISDGRIDWSELVKAWNDDIA